MAALNKVMIIGNLGRDPEAKMTPSGQKVSNFSVAVTEKYTDKQGQKQEKTEWVNVVFWGKQAEICEQYLKKGSPIYVEGKLQTQSWEDDNGVKKYRTDVVGSVLKMIGSGQSKAESNNNEHDMIEEDLPF
jgi:single-strand DNA-binding protein